MNCRDLISEYFDWVRQKPGVSEGYHAVGAKMAILKIRQNNPRTYP